ncbi:Uncharacterized protein TCM_013521 [Theobroma cacao]|uniref:Uncharacterized protein n=1 Tax=Theobroma cacao TaxID=3641 RepID=A0A061FX28_THECC|nr:Uncharacterized protein TCM_013521 [Theobroma cacao]
MAPKRARARASSNGSFDQTRFVFANAMARYASSLINKITIPNDITKDRAIFIHSIMMGLTITFGYVIFKAMTHITKIKQDGLQFLSLIIAMCKMAGVHYDANEELLHLELTIDINLILIQL